MLLTPGIARADEGALPQCSDRVIQLFEAGRHIEAARAAESCWTTSGDPRLMHFAAQAREGAGHVSHAVFWYRRYLALLPVDAPSRERVQGRLDALTPKVVAVTVTAPAAKLTFLCAGRPDRLDVEWAGGEGVVYLEPGQCRAYALDGSLVERVFQAEAASRVALVAAPVVTPPAAPVSVLLPGPDSPVPAPSRTTRARIGLGTALGATSMGLGIWGAVWVAEGRLRAKELDTQDLARPPTKALNSYALWVDGAAVLAAAGGTLTVGLTHATGLRRLPIAIETGLGAGLAIAGAIWRGTARRTMVEGSRDILPSAGGAEYQQFLDDRRPREIVAAAMFGFGLGSAVAGTISLITMAALGRRPDPVRRLEPLAGPRTLGIQGRF
jgi:hypothetical protein